MKYKLFLTFLTADDRMFCHIKKADRKGLRTLQLTDELPQHENIIKKQQILVWQYCPV